MRGDDEYELMPHTELEYLRREVERLKRNPLGDTKQGADLLTAVNRLNENVAKLVDIFQGANDEMLKAFHDTSIQDQLRKIREENAKLAHGIVAVAQLVKEAQKAGPLPKIDALAQPKAVPPQPAISLSEHDLASELQPRPPNPFAEAPGQYSSMPPVRQASIPSMEVPPPPPRP